MLSVLNAACVSVLQCLYGIFLTDDMQAYRGNTHNSSPDIRVSSNGLDGTAISFFAMYHRDSLDVLQMVE